MAPEREVLSSTTSAPDQPRLIFFSELAGGDLLELLRRPGLLDLLETEGHGVALAMAHLDEARASAARLLIARSIPLVAWLLLPPEAGFAFNLQNYPQAIAHYRAFRVWAQEHELDF